jgi:fumarylacetoacetate (FAA) hydrolase
MKFATYQDGSRDGQLLVVSRDLSQAHYASDIANRLQQVLEDWNYFSPLLQDLSDRLNAGRARYAFAFEANRCMAPLPRAYSYTVGLAYPSHWALVSQTDAQWAKDFSPPIPSASCVAGDSLLGPCETIAWGDSLGLDYGAELAVITSDVPKACHAERALDAVRLVMLSNALRWHAGQGASVSTTNPPSPVATAFSPVAVTPDELGSAWSKGRVHLPLQCMLNGRKFGLCDAGTDMRLHFGELIAQASQLRGLRAGALISTGPVSNQGVEKKGKWSWPKGSSCIAEKRAMEIVQNGQCSSPWLQDGDVVRIEMKNGQGESVFGAIEQEVVVTQRV